MHVCTIIFLLVAVPPATEMFTTISDGRDVFDGMVFIIIGRIISPSSSFTTSPGSACKKLSSTAGAIKQGCINVIVR